MRMAGFRNLNTPGFWKIKKSVEQRNAHYTALKDCKPPTIFEKTKMYSQRMEIQREPKGGGSWGKLAPRLLCYARFGRASSTWPHPPLLDSGGVRLRGQKIISLSSVLNKRDFQKEPAGWLDPSPWGGGGRHLSKQNTSWANHALGFQYLPAIWAGWKEEGKTLSSGEKIFSN